MLLFLPFLGAVAKLRKATVSFVISVCSSAWDNPESHWTDFFAIRYLNISLYSVEKIRQE